MKKFNNYRYLLQVIDVFLKYLHSVPLRTKTGKEVAAALESIFKDPNTQNPYADGACGCVQIRAKSF